MKKLNKPDSEMLRIRAEELLKKEEPINQPISQPTNLTEQKMLKLIHELEVHQIELELQNDELLRIRTDAQIAADKYNHLFDFAPCGYFTLTKESLILELNLHGSKMLNLGRMFLINKPLSLFISYSSKSVFNLFLEKTFSTHVQQSCELSISNYGGLPIYVQLTAIVTQNADHCLATMVDITERNLIAAKLQKSETRFKNMFDHNNAIMFLIEPVTGKIIDANNAAQKYYGYSKTKLLAMFIHDINYVSAEQTKIELEKPFTTDQNYFIFTHRLATGEERTVEVNSTQIDYQNNPILFSIVHDITDQKLAEEKLNLEYAFRNSIELSLSCGIAIADKFGRQTYVNPAFCKLVGWTAEELTGQTAPYLYWPADQIQIINKAFEDTLSNNAPKEGFELVFINKNSDRFPVQLIITPFSDGTQIFGWIANVTDITHRKQVQEEIKQKNDALQKLNSDKNRFIHLLAHDLRNPMLSITGFSSLLAKNVRSYDIEKTVNYVSSINDASKRMFNLLEDILKWALTQSEHKIFKPKQTNLTLICNEVVGLLNIVASTKNIGIAYTETEGINVYADNDMLKAILRNLISNAIKFSNSLGQINISAIQNETNVSITVSDNGIGMIPETMNKLFDLTQIHSSQGTDGEKGTGLGLILCQEFVERHSGKIWVQSQFGIGSEFSFELPNE